MSLRTRSARSCLLLGALGLTGCLEFTDPGVRRPELAVFPSWDVVVDGQISLAPLPSAATKMPEASLQWRDGFSPMQTAVIHLGIALDPTSLPGVDAIGTDGTVQVWDLDAGGPVLAFAEVDAWEGDSLRGPALLVRPQVPIPPGHRMAIVLRPGILEADGTPLATVDWYQAALDNEPAEGQEELARHLADLDSELAALGVDDALLAFDFPVSEATSPLKRLLEDLELPISWDVEETSGALPPGTSTAYEGAFTTTDWLGDAGQFTLDASGLPVAVGQTEAVLYIHLPSDFDTAAPGTMPVWIFGHGIFAEPQYYLADSSDPSAVAEIADSAGAIVIGTTWRGLTTSDVAVPATVAGDFGTIPQLADRLAQGVANTLALASLIADGSLLDDPLFEGKADPDSLSYYGISLGGIEGVVLLANAPMIDHGVLHVGGSTWSTLLERSKHWATFEDLIKLSIGDPGDRQLLYSTSQLYFDPVDPIHWAGGLQGRSALWQISIGDDQVANLTSWAVARQAGAGVLQPARITPVGMQPVSAPATGIVLAQFDPELGNHEADNRPSPETRAHDEPRLWGSTKAQTVRFLTDGTAEHTCGDTVCGPP